MELMPCDFYPISSLECELFARFGGANCTARKVIFNPPATIVLWEDETKTVVKCDPHDEYDKMKGVALCYMKKFLGNTSRELNKALRASGAYVDKTED